MSVQASAESRGRFARARAPMRIIDVGSGCHGTVCIDGRCLICRADWGELAKRFLSVEFAEYIPPPPPTTCAAPWCTTEFEPRDANQRFCSKQCAKRKVPPPPPTTCHRCGTRIERPRRTQRFCSETCSRPVIPPLSCQAPGCEVFMEIRRDSRQIFCSAKCRRRVENIRERERAKSTQVQCP